jgi:hypothetical protein
MNWRAITGVPRDCTNEKQKAWHRLENVVVENGQLNLITHKVVDGRES